MFSVFMSALGDEISYLFFVQDTKLTGRQLALAYEVRMIVLVEPAMLLSAC